MTAALAVRSMVAGYGGVPVVHGVDLHVDHGEVVALLGANGSGKTTMLLTVSGLVPVLGGDIEVLGQLVRHTAKVRPAEVARRARAGVAHVSEDRALFMDLTAAENLRLAVTPARHRRRGGGGRSDPQDDQAVGIDEVMDWFPLLARVSSRRAGLLSGGEQQMLALARAVVARPRLLLVDEMSLGLAPLIVEQLLPSLGIVARRTGAGVLVVEQHVGLALSVADRAYLLGRGRVLASGTSSDMAGSESLLEAGYLGARPPTGIADRDEPGTP